MASSEPFPAITTGDAVELRVRFTGGWSAGFVVVAEEQGGYWVRRLSDGAVLPTLTSAADIRLLERAAAGVSSQ